MIAICICCCHLRLICLLSYDLSVEILIMLLRLVVTMLYILLLPISSVDDKLILQPLLVIKLVGANIKELSTFAFFISCFHFAMWGVNDVTNVPTRLQ